jgi:hypothetical protein
MVSLMLGIALGIAMLIATFFVARLLNPRDRFYGFEDVSSALPVPAFTGVICGLFLPWLFHATH